MTTLPLSLEHLIRPPRHTSAKAPALFLFHGYGSNEEDLFSFSTELPEELCIISVRAPHPMPPYGYAWYAINFDANFGKWSDVEQAKESMGLMVTFIKESIEGYRLDADRISLLGFSQGTVLSLALALSFPELVKNVIGLSGYIDENILIDSYKEKDHRQLSMYISHGRMDPVIPFSWAEKTPPILENLGIDFVFEDFPTGHGVSQENFYAMNAWLKKHI
ncbi:alpha/beta hydrolase [Muriicola sp.]|uniref:alpha/beta hydrolase n=1 Tax=Muriicola sp. TaxID=2020856 RepID=UPI003C73A837